MKYIKRTKEIDTQVQIIAEFPPDYRLAQFKDGLVEIIYHNGNWVGWEMQGRLLHRLFNPKTDFTTCEKCQKRIATEKYSQLSICAWCGNVLNDEFDDEYV